MNLSVIIPCLDEAQAIEPVLEQTYAVLNKIHGQGVISGFEVIVVNDGSSDDSHEILKSWSCREPDLQVITHGASQGYGYSLKAGMRKSRGDCIAFYDMDATYSPEDLVPALKLYMCSDVDMIVGDRLSGLSGMPLSRKIGNHFFKSVISQIFRVGVKDCCSGFRLFCPQYKRLFLEYLPDNLNFTLAMTFLFLRFRLKFIEMPIFYGSRLGESKLSILLDGPRFLMTILYYWCNLRFSKAKIAQIERILSLKNKIA